MGFRTVFVKNGQSLRLKLDNLEVIKESRKVTIPLSDIDLILLEGDKTFVTSRLLAKLSQYQIDLVICDHHFMPCGIYLGMGQYHRSAKRQLWQAKWTDFEKNTIWTSIVEQKMKNQIELCKRLDFSDERVSLMESIAQDLLEGDSSNREGHLAKVYFNTLFGMGLRGNYKILKMRVLIMAIRYYVLICHVVL